MHRANASPLAALFAESVLLDADEPHAASPKAAPMTMAKLPTELGESMPQGLRNGR